MPIWPLLATVAVQSLATMALYSMPILAPEVARDLKVNRALVGGFVATSYGVGIASALLSPGLIRRFVQEPTGDNRQFVPGRTSRVKPVGMLCCMGFLTWHGLCVWVTEVFRDGWFSPHTAEFDDPERCGEVRVFPNRRWAR